MGDGYVVAATSGERFDLGVIEMRLLVSSDQTNGAFAVAEFQGGEGAVGDSTHPPEMEESFYVLEGDFTFTCPIGPGSIGDRGSWHPASRVASQASRLP